VSNIVAGVCKHLSNLFQFKQLPNLFEHIHRVFAAWVITLFEKRKRRSKMVRDNHYEKEIFKKTNQLVVKLIN
jgi:hypothetical protein